MSSHAELSPSSAARWMRCPGSVKACDGLPDEPSKFADEGTAAHFLASECLTRDEEPFSHLGRTILVTRAGAEWLPKGWAAGNAASSFLVDQDMCLAVLDYVDYVRGVAKSTGGQTLVEQRLPIDSITGEAGAHGTSDAVILAERELIVIDLKYGRGVAVDAEDNEQLQIYALAAFREFSLAQDFDRVRMVIHQPRLGAVSEATLSIDDLADFGERVLEAAGFTQYPDALLNPSEEACRWCRAKATCPALRAEVVELFGAVPAPQAESADVLADCMAKVDLIEGWCKAVRAEVETRLLTGKPVRGWKVVQGKRGNRKWTSEAEAEEALKAMRIKHDQMYDYSVISPTTAEKLAKTEVIGPRQWPKLQALITQAEGKPSVAPESDKRPALVMSAVDEEFEDVTATASTY
jgi:hypothetical protein